MDLYRHSLHQVMHWCESHGAIHQQIENLFATISPLDPTRSFAATAGVIVLGNL
jgi:hypothetical protein